MGGIIYNAGAEFLRQLRNNATQLLKEPYAVFIIALATSNDVEALQWIVDNAKSLDSITGYHAAFLFFASRENDEKRISPRWASIYHNSQEPDVEGLYLHNNLSIEMLSEAMTYESDSVARELGILDKLPCLVFIDDPASSNFTLMSLKNADNQTVKDIRELINNFIGAPENATYFTILKEFHGAKNQRKKALSSLTALRHAPLTEIEACQKLLLDGKAKEFREKLNRISVTEKVDWKAVRESSDRIATAKYFIKKINNFSNGTLPKHKQEKLSKSILLRKVAEVLQQPSELLENITLAESIVMLDNFIVHETNYALLLGFGHIMKEEKIDLIGFQRRINEIESTIDRLYALEERLLNNLAKQKRPSLIPYLEEFYKRRNRQVFFHKIQNITATAANKAPTLLDVLAKGIALMKT